MWPLSVGVRLLIEVRTCACVGTCGTVLGRVESMHRNLRLRLGTLLPSCQSFCPMMASG